MMYSRIQSLRASNSYTTPRYGVVGIKRALSETQKGRLRSFTENSAVRADSAVSGAMVYSPHPDAIRRRREAEERCVCVQLVPCLMFNSVNLVALIRHHILLLIVDWNACMLLQALGFALSACLSQVDIHHQPQTA